MTGRRRADSPRARIPARPRVPASSRAVLVYLAVAVAWVLVSGAVVDAIAPHDALAPAALVASLLFVGGTALALGLVLARGEHQIEVARRALEEADRQRALLATAVEQSAETVMVTDAAGDVVYVNEAFERSSGYRREDILGRNPRLLRSEEVPDSFFRGMWDTLLSGKPFTGDFLNRRKDGTLFQEASTISPIQDDEGRITSYVAVKRDVTREREVEKREARLARERALVSETLELLEVDEGPEATARAICRQISTLSDVALASLFMFDVIGQASPLANATPGGNPPPLLALPERRTQQLRERAEQGPWVEEWQSRPWHPYDRYLVEQDIRANAYAPVRHGGRTIGVLIVGSAGEGASTALTERLPAIVEFAELTGALLGPALSARTEADLVRRRVREVIRHHAFEPVYQPIVDVESGQVVGIEALTVFDDGTPPEVMFEEAAAVGIGLELERATLQAAIGSARELDDPLFLTLNVSPALILQRSTLAGLLGGCPVPVVLEITEHDRIPDYPAFRDAIAELDPRVRLGVDDAGSGYATLSHVIELRPSVVKLDRALVTGLHRDPARQAIVAGMRHYALATGCDLIAEGVESEGELRTLRDLGVRLAQGYFLGLPRAAGADIAGALRAS